MPFRTTICLTSRASSVTRKRVACSKPSYIAALRDTKCAPESGFLFAAEGSTRVIRLRLVARDPKSTVLIVSYRFELIRQISV